MRPQLAWEHIQRDVLAGWDQGARFAHYVYRQYDADGDLLYVGYTTHGGTREYFHSVLSEWKSEIDVTRYEVYETLDEALAAEAAAIDAEDPKWNGPSRRWAAA